VAVPKEDGVGAVNPDYRGSRRRRANKDDSAGSAPLLETPCSPLTLYQALDLPPQFASCPIALTGAAKSPASRAKKIVDYGTWSWRQKCQLAVYRFSPCVKRAEGVVKGKTAGEVSD
jgi:hypothetical protein